MIDPDQPNDPADDKLDEALDETFPASDPIALDPRLGEPAEQGDMPAPKTG